MNQSVAIYCVCFPKHEPFKIQKYQQNIMCNAHGIEDAYRETLIKKGFVFDDSGDNISTLNWAFGDLTATYWIWKNSPYDIVGTSQYRRFWDNSIANMEFRPNTLYVQKPYILDKSIKDQYIECHGELGIAILEKLVTEKKIPLTQAMLDKTYAFEYLHSCNMFIAHKELYDRFCKILFDIVFEVYAACKDHLDSVEPYNKRIPAFLGERIVMALIVNKEHFFPGIDVVPLKWSVKKKPLLKKLFGF